MKIENKQIRDIYDRWDSIWRSESTEKSVRLKAFSILRVIESLVAVYEADEKLSQDEVDDLFIAWRVDRHSPIFPEDTPKMIERIQGIVKELEGKSDNTNKNNNIKKDD